MAATTLLPFNEVLSRLLAEASAPVDVEKISLTDAQNRILAEPLYARENLPQEPRSSMDGYALRHADLKAKPLAISQRIAAGQIGHPLKAGTVARIFTGAALPLGADTVLMQEDCVEKDGAITCEQDVTFGQWVRSIGSDIRAGDTLLTVGTRLSSAQLGLAAMVGAGSVTVFSPIKVALLTNGDELVMPGDVLPPGGAFNANYFSLLALLRRCGCAVTWLGNLPDNVAAVRQSIRSAAQTHQMILSTGGASVGEEDHIRTALEAEGRLEFWSLAIKPGKPLCYGNVGKAHFIGLPGNPVSSFVTFLMLVRPFLTRLQGAAYDLPVATPLKADFEWLKPDMRRREFLRVRRTASGLALHPQQNSAVLASCAWADGLVDNPPGGQIRRGDTVNYFSFAELIP